MKRLIQFAWLLFAASAVAQAPSYNNIFDKVPIAPSGACSNNAPQNTFPGGQVCTCSNGTWACAVPGSTSGSGVTSFSGDGTILNNSASTGAVTATLANAAQNSVLAGPATGGAGAPTYQTAPTFAITNLTGTCTACSANSVANALTLNNSNSGAASGTTYNGSAGVTASANTFGAGSLANTNTWGAINTYSAALHLAAGTMALPELAWFNTTSSTYGDGIYQGASGDIRITIQGTDVVRVNPGSGGAIMTALDFWGWGSSGVGSPDTFLKRQGVGVVEVGNNSGGTLGALELGQIIGGTPAPTMAAGAAAGTSPSCTSITGTNLAGVISCTTGTSTTTGILATITFNGTQVVAPQGCHVTPRNAATAPTATSVYTTAPSTTTWTISVATALTASTAYSWSFICI
jgi:hypothetical protein